MIRPPSRAINSAAICDPSRKARAFMSITFCQLRLFSSITGRKVVRAALLIKTSRRSKRALTWSNSPRSISSFPTSSDSIEAATPIASISATVCRADV